MKDQPADQTLPERARLRPFDLRTRRLNQLAILYPRGTDRLTGATIQALIHLAHKTRIGQSQLAPLHCLDQMDPSTRRGGLMQRLQIGWAMWQTHPTAHTT